MQDIKVIHENDVFLYQGIIVGASHMGNMAVGYTAYRNYGLFGAIGICVLGEVGWPDLGDFWGGVQRSFEANSYGIAEGIIQEYNNH